MLFTLPFPLLTSGSVYLLVLSTMSLLTLTSSSFSLQPYLYSSIIMLDNFSVWLSFVTFLVVFASLIVYYNFSWKFSIFMGLVTITSLGVFSTHSLALLYILYEFSLVPIVYIIAFWGNYPDRGISSLMMILYTSFFSLPLMMALFFFLPWGTFSLFSGWIMLSPHSAWVTIIVILAFSVKLPLYGVHFWLPMAHVEAPTPGSMVLAGVLLKLGGCGLYRFSMVFPIWTARYWLLSYSILCTLFVSLIALTQSDFKRLIAYSSVVHMSVLVISLLSFLKISISSFLVIMVCHGFSSPVMFLIVGSVYSWSNTRLITLLRGVLLYSPTLAFFLSIAFISNIPTPPMSSFLGEVMLFLSIGSLGSFITLFIIIYGFLAILFNVFWYTSVTYGPPMMSAKWQPVPTSYGEFMGLVIFTFSLLALIPLLGQF